MIRVAVLGLGNLGKAVLRAARLTPDVVPVAAFTRRDPTSMTLPVPVYRAKDLPLFQEKVDVFLLCGGSANDLPDETVAVTERFHTVNTFDTHAAIPEHLAAVDAVARKTGHVALLCTGWDPGLLSLIRLYTAVLMPDGATHTFWGPGLSQGHSAALRHIDGVSDAREITLPHPDALEAALRGDTVPRTATELHRRACYVVKKEGADEKRITETIRTMPHYFAGYDTSVTFVDEATLLRDNASLAHGGHVIRNGADADGGAVQATFSLSMASNPLFTAGIVLSSARAVHRLAKEGAVGAKTLFDVPPAYLAALTRGELLSLL